VFWGVSGGILGGVFDPRFSPFLGCFWGSEPPPVYLIAPRGRPGTPPPMHRSDENASYGSIINIGTMWSNLSLQNKGVRLSTLLRRFSHPVFDHFFMFFYKRVFYRFWQKVVSGGSFLPDFRVVFDPFLGHFWGVFWPFLGVFGGCPKPGGIRGYSGGYPGVVPGGSFGPLWGLFLVRFSVWGLGWFWGVFGYPGVSE
jgi:hypothetical protein